MSGKNGELGQLAVKFTWTPRADVDESCTVASSAATPAFSNGVNRIVVLFLFILN